ncbi:LysR family transcriptional regulator [Frateuria defendens]|uniref:LysR family transcriptional regulator n=1 Tax=Frateuria defendens TaxID=2219559 RepID=UPI00066FBE5D|nr:LysR family transcriptional regulator [Frateuria defendens]
MHEWSNIDAIVAFATVAEHASFVAAGRVLGRDPTVISRRVQALEGRLGVRLLARSTRRVALTEAGAAYLARVQPILRELTTADREAAAFAAGAPRGRLRIAAPGTFGRMWLAPLLSEFLAAHPAVTLEVSFSNRFVDLIGEGFDIAVRLGVLPDSRLVARQIARRRRLVCASPAYLARHGEPATPEALARHACLIFSGFPTPHYWQFSDASGTTQAANVDGPFVSDDAEALVAAAVAGRGLMMATDWLVGRELADGRLVPILPDWSVADEGAIYVVMPSSDGLPSKTRAFADFMLERMRHPPWLGIDQ